MLRAAPGGQYFTQTNAYFIVLERSQSAGKRRSPRPDLREGADQRAGGSPVTCEHRTNQTGPLSVSHQAQFPAVTLSSISAGTSLGRRWTVARAEREIGKPQSLIGTFQGNAQASRTRCRASDPDRGALFVVYVILACSTRVTSTADILSTLRRLASERSRIVRRRVRTCR